MNVQLKKAAPLLFVAILVVLLFVIRQSSDEVSGKTETSISKKTGNDSSGIDRDKSFDRRISYLDYSKHAKCRMQCRKISNTEVEEIMKNGKINYNKSDLENARCPRYTVEGTTVDEQKIRIVFAQCNDKTTVVTVIDLNTEWSCDCPGDDKKYENKN